MFYNLARVRMVSYIRHKYVQEYNAIFTIDVELIVKVIQTAVVRG